MTNSSPIYWSVGGTSLQTYAMNIETLGGDRMSPPPVRGTNLTVPSAPGRVWMPKQVDQRVITLGMWIQGCNADGTVPTDRTQHRKFMDNWNALKSLLWTPEKQITLTKRFYDSGGVVRTASALAQFSSGLTPTMTGGTRAVFTVDLALADPYFYGTAINQSLSGTQNVTVGGDYRTHAIKFNVTGARNNLKIRNNTLGVQVQYTGNLATNDKLDIDVKAYTSVTDPVATSPYNSIGNILNDGDASWFLLQPGVNNISTTSDSGIGAVIMTRQEVYL